MKKLKYIICDLDGTLLNDERRISPRQAEYLCDLYKRKDIRFGFASGRALTSLIPIAKDAGILKICDVMVANNGVDIYDVKNKRKTETLMVSVEDIRTILELMKQYEWINVTFHNPNGLYGLYETPRTRQIVEINHFDSRPPFRVFNRIRTFMIWPESECPRQKAWKSMCPHRGIPWSRCLFLAMGKMIWR